MADAWIKVSYVHGFSQDYILSSSVFLTPVLLRVQRNNSPLRSATCLLCHFILNLPAISFFQILFHSLLHVFILWSAAEKLTYSGGMFCSETDHPSAFTWVGLVNVIICLERVSDQLNRILLEMIIFWDDKQLKQVLIESRARPT